MYTIKERNKYGEYQVSIFDGDKEPSKTYQVHIKGHSIYCSCPGYPRTPGPKHKHVRLVKEWLNAGSPWLAAIEITQDNQIQIRTPIPIAKPENIS